MAVVIGFDFGTLSVRASVVDSARGVLASAISEYPLHRRRDDPDFATQSHADHMRAMVEACRRALKEAGVPGEHVDGWPVYQHQWSAREVDHVRLAHPA